ncbi:MAG: sensor histidine kinase [Candidatus Margulisiibacteriota bacterium]
MQTESEQLKLYLRIKYWVVGTAALLIGAETALGVVSATASISSFVAMAVALLSALPLQVQINRQKSTIASAYLSLSFDLLLIIVALYFNGGIENTWLFFPVFVIFISGYFFTLRASLIYAFISYAAILLMFLLEYYKIIPHFGIYNLPELYWRNTDYCIDYLVGMFMLYFFAAFSSGYLNQTMRQRAEKLRQSLAETQAAQQESENARRALLNLTEDLTSARNALEARVKERTAELEEAKASLERKVAERTANLEASRKAILHMMKNLHEDMDKLRLIDRMKTEFLSMVSHELRTPLTPIKGYLYLLTTEKMGKLSEEQKKALEIISRQSEHLQTLIDSILDLSRIERGVPIPLKKEPLSIKSVIEEVVEAMKIQAQACELKVSLELQENLPTIMGDPIKLKRVITNLLGNALKFTPRGGEIKIRAFAADSAIRIEVIDNGIGIAPENLERIFEKFYQVDSSLTRPAGGMGIGLSIAKEIVELHGGKIWAESEGLGRGSKFIFILPIGGEE